LVTASIPEKETQIDQIARGKTGIAMATTSVLHGQIKVSKSYKTTEIMHIYVSKLF
jgi:hypothetical protein